MSKSKLTQNAILAANSAISRILSDAKQQSAKAGTLKFRAVVAWLETTPPDLVAAATTPAKVGVKSGTVEAMELSQVRAIDDVMRSRPADFATIRELAEDSGWEAIMVAVRDVRREVKAERAEVKADAKVQSVAKAAKLDAAAAADLLAKAREARLAEAAAKAAEAKRDPTPAEVAARIARKLIDDKGAAFARAVADALDAAIDAAMKAANEKAKVAA